MKDFKAISEELDDIKLYDGQKSNEPSIPLDEAFEIIAAKRKSKA